MIIKNKTIAPYWIANQSATSPTHLHPNIYQPTKFAPKELQDVLDNQPKRRHRMLGHELIDAAQKGLLLQVRSACEIDGINPDSVDTDLWGDTALMRACEYGHLHVVRYLVLNAQANLELKDNTGDHALRIAQKWKRAHVVAFLEGFLSWQRKAESSTYLTRRAATHISASPKQLMLKLNV
jgi:ankyrin repeat protein